MRSAARRNETASYVIKVSVTGGGSNPVPTPQDQKFWQVTGLAAGDSLALRARPSTDAMVKARFVRNTTLRGLGCRTVDAQRWCHVENREGSLKGWVARGYLRPASGWANPVPGDALVPGTNYNATGTLPCAREEGQPTTACTFGVVRRGNGNATVFVSLPGGGTRSIVFRDKDAVSSNRKKGKLRSSRTKGLNFVTIGPERYEIPAAVVTGG